MKSDSPGVSAAARHAAQRIQAAPVLELLAITAPGDVLFRYRASDLPDVNANLDAALRACGFTVTVEEVPGGGHGIRATFGTQASTNDADALVNAAIVLGNVAANGNPVPRAVTSNLLPDGLPAYIGFAGLWRLAVSGIEIARLGPMLDARVVRNPDDAASLLDIATLLFLTLLPGNRVHAFDYQNRALALQQLFRLPATRAGEGVRVLVVAGPGEMTALTPLDCLTEDSDIELIMLYARPGLPLPARLPEHDLVFVAIGESPASRALLGQIETFANTSPKRVLNPPGRILEMSRDRVAARLQGVPGVVMPVTVGIGRDAAEQIARGELPVGRVLADGAYPIIVRPLDSQGGKGLEKLNSQSELMAYLEKAEAPGFFLSRFVDYRGPDGQYRKYRVALIGGRPYACHMAI